MQHAGVDRLNALYSAIDIVRRGGTISLTGVDGGTADLMPMLMLFDKQIQLRMGQYNVKKWIDDILPLLGDDDPLGCDTFAPTGSPSTRRQMPTAPSKRRRAGTSRSSSSRRRRG